MPDLASEASEAGFRERRDGWIPWLSLVVLLTLAGFVFGLAVGRYEIWPFQLISQMMDIVRSVEKTGWIYPENLVVLRPDHASDEQVYVAAQVAPVPGYRPIMGYEMERESFVVWLLDESGRILHVWPIDYSSLDADGASGRSDMPHGLEVLEDGSIIVNFDKGDLMARLDGCGRPIWINSGVYHHSIERAEDGTYWTWAGDSTAYGDHQYLVNFDAESGETLKRLSLVDDIIRPSTSASLWFALPNGYQTRHFETKPREENDIFHPNDVEALSSELAASFPGFEAGDLLISLRNLSLVAVIDPNSRTLRWVQRGPWRFQHDPDFLSDGTISVYDNNSDRGYSAIVLVNPSTGESWFRYPPEAVRFYSHSMGKHEQLPDGGVQIVVPEEGRVFEVDSEGHITFEFNNLISDKRNGHVENATWLPPGYFSSTPKCES